MKQTVQALLKKYGYQLTRTAPPVDTFGLAAYERNYPVETLQRKPFYNVGSGSFWHPYWTNLDYITEHYKSVQRDVIHYDLMNTQPLPIETGAAEVIYTSHTIEHVKDEAVLRLFKEAYRALRTGGIFRVTTGPDAETDYAALQRGDMDWFYWDNWYAVPGSYEHLYHQPANSVPLAERWLAHVATQLAPNSISPSVKKKYSAAEIEQVLASNGLTAALDFFCGQCQFDPVHPGNHVSWWTHEKVTDYLRLAGFRNAYRSGYGQSILPILRNTYLFDNTHPQISLYVETVR